MSEKNPLIGHWVCDAGGTAEVRQTKKRGNHFYTFCECCGLNQGTAPKRQQRIWDTATFLPGVTVVRPSNVQMQGESIALQSDKPSEPASDEPSGGLSDYTPGESEPEQTIQAVPGVNKARLIGGLMLLLAAGVGAWMN